MKAFRADRRRFLQSTASAAAAGGLALLGTGLSAASAAETRGRQDLQGLRKHIDHIIVIVQENRSFDHYFGTYRPRGGHLVAGLLDSQQQVDRRFTGLQKNPAGMAYVHLPLPYQIASFEQAVLPNRPFHLAPYLPSDANVRYDPLHQFFRMFAQIDHGKMDHFVALAAPGEHDFLAGEHGIGPGDAMLAQSSPSGVVLGFYERADLPGYHHLADEYVLFDHFFQAMSGGSTGNALYLVAARSAQWSSPPSNAIGSPSPPVFSHPYDRHGVLVNDVPPANGPSETYMGPIGLCPPPGQQTFPSIADRLEAAGLSWVWYNEGWNAVKPWALRSADGPGDGSVVVDTPEVYVPHHNPFQYFPSWFRNVRAGHIRDSGDFLEDARSGRLPRVCFLKATGSRDEHPADSAPRWGERWVLGLLRALGESPLWERSLVLITYDEGGGYWDHVAPPRPDAYGCGTRVPALLVSPWARRGYVDHRVADTTSVLALIETRFALRPLQRRDAIAYNLLDGLDFGQAPRVAEFG